MKALDFLARKIELVVFQKPAQGLGGEIHIVSDVPDDVRWNVGDRAELLYLLRDTANKIAHSRQRVVVDLVERNCGGDKRTWDRRQLGGCLSFC